MNFEGLERRIEGFNPQVKICDKWVPIECIVDAYAFLGKEFEHAFREEWGDDIADYVMENVING